MKTILVATAFIAGMSVAAMAQQPASTAGAPQMLSSLPASKTVTDYYKHDVYDPSKTEIGKIDDVLIDNDGHITALIIGVGGFLGMGEKDVAVAFDSVQATRQNSSWYLVLNTTKAALKSAPGFTYNKASSTWVPASK